jgi:uncharacterized cupin superfamily protein
MKATRLYTGSDGESHFEDIEIPLVPGDPSEQRSEKLKATGIIFRETTGSFDLNWHNAPARQYVLTLQGRAEITVGDGTKRQFGPGDIMLAEDLAGRGHITRGVGSQPRISIFVTLD